MDEEALAQRYLHRRDVHPIRNRKFERQKRVSRHSEGRRNGDISVVEVKKWGHPDFQKWKILGELQFYTFLIETQYKQDNEDFIWMANLITKGMLEQEHVDAIERRIREEKEIVVDWIVLIVGGNKEEIEQDECLWHMHDYINFGDETNSWFRPLNYIHLIEKNGEFICDNLECWFRKDEEAEPDSAAQRRYRDVPELDVRAGQS